MVFIPIAHLLVCHLHRPFLSARGRCGELDWEHDPSGSLPGQRCEGKELRSVKEYLVELFWFFFSLV